MNDVRGDIASAARRMRVSFGTRSAMKHLVHSLEAGETVKELVACVFGGANGLLVLTDRRVIAIRDDYSRYCMKSAAFDQITAIDYGPQMHDGFAVVTQDGKVAVRKMNREDSDRLVDALREILPDVPVEPSHPSPLHRKAARITRKVHVLTHPVTQPAPDLGDDDDGVATPPVVLAAPSPLPDLAAQVPAQVPACHTSKDVLYGVLADLHKQGLLTAEELAVKVAAVASAS